MRESTEAPSSPKAKEKVPAKPNKFKKQRPSKKQGSPATIGLKVRHSKRTKAILGVAKLLNNLRDEDTLSDIEPTPETEFDKAVSSDVIATEKNAKLIKTEEELYQEELILEPEEIECPNPPEDPDSPPSFPEDIPSGWTADFFWLLPHSTLNTHDTIMVNVLILPNLEIIRYAME